MTRSLLLNTLAIWLALFALTAFAIISDLRAGPLR